MPEFELQIFANNKFCEGAQPIVSGAAAIVSSVEKAAEQLVIFCEDVDQISSSHLG
jgi:ribosomal protein L7Ae-like RNA K-turn-binding protein